MKTERQKAIKKPKRKSKRSLIKKLDKVYSLYIRLVNRIDGRVHCFTCGLSFDYKNIDCGHYVGRDWEPTRWMRENTQPQCVSCNRFHEGRKDVFALRLIREYGDDILKRIDTIKNSGKRYSMEEIEDLIQYYSKRVKELKISDD